MKIKQHIDENGCRYITYVYKGVTREFGRKHCFSLDILEEKFTKLDKKSKKHDI